jgi:sulfur-carrier protein adenylyltransferase/sulfurtransferase
VGGRSRVAAQLLVGRGFTEVYNLSGGIKAWQGEVAEGPVELNMDMVRGDETPAEIIRLAYGMEHSLGEFYKAAKSIAGDKDVVGLLDTLSIVEDKHKAYLADLGKSIDPLKASAEALEAAVASNTLEGGFNSAEFLKKNEGFMQSVPALLDLSMMVETQAFDLYFRFSGKTENEQTKKVLHKIADEEKGHLAALGALRDAKV